MRKVLVPTDFSDNAYNALKYASQVFKYERSEFIILHTYADEVYREEKTGKRASLEKLKRATLESVEEKLGQIQADLRKYSPNPKHSYAFVPVFGGLIDAANEWVNQENIDIVVMGTRGATNDRRTTFGTNTLQLMKYVQCPVLAVPEGYEYHPPKNVLFASDLMLPFKRRELKLLADMTGSFRSKVHVLYNNPVENLSFRQMDNKKFLQGCLQKTESIFTTTAEGDKTLAITKYIEQSDIDMLAMINSRHSHLEDMLATSTIDQLGLHVKVPFMVMQNIAR
ncbi:universal stress protein [Pricia sp. S334]|uniref:Universal stress protein n=1 Tax=Pricia mediterranea TaxID=3076079 RepID=A0ABU3L2U7_9FLAO|nr:universal stress protein [Pricia sp. S334]MDT7827412.1 universal stress protein [Pricia sp. S334]